LPVIYYLSQSPLINQWKNEDIKSTSLGVFTQGLIKKTYVTASSEAKGDRTEGVTLL